MLCETYEYCIVLCWKNCSCVCHFWINFNIYPTNFKKGPSVEAELFLQLLPLSAITLSWLHLNNRTNENKLQKFVVNQNHISRVQKFSKCFKNTADLLIRHPFPFLITEPLFIAAASHELPFHWRISRSSLLHFIYLYPQLHGRAQRNDGGYPRTPKRYNPSITGM